MNIGWWLVDMKNWWAIFLCLLRHCVICYTLGRCHAYYLGAGYVLQETQKKTKTSTASFLQLQKRHRWGWKRGKRKKPRLNVSEGLFTTQLSQRHLTIVLIANYMKLTMIKFLFLVSRVNVWTGAFHQSTFLFIRNLRFLRTMSIISNTVVLH